MGVTRNGIRSWAALSVVGAGILPASMTWAQVEPKPLSNVGGYAQSQLSNIYRQDIGQGYTGASLNSIALSNARNQVGIGYYGQTSSSVSGGARVGGSPRGGGITTGKPFSGFSPSPTVSPYLNLFREDFSGNSDLNYPTLVRPMLQQQQFNQQVQRQSMELSRRLQTMAAQNDYGQPQGDKNQFPTGHQTVYRYFGHYHPTAPYRPGKQAP